MFDSMKQFIADYQGLLIGMLVIAVLTGILSKASSRLWVRDFRVRFPVFGNLAGFAKDRTKGSNGWMRAEENLCSIYKQYVTILPQDKFDQRIEYLRKCGDLGKTPMPGWMFPILFILVVAEGLGFSYILGTWMAREGSANTHTLLMFAIVFVLAVILSVTTHAAGHQLRRTLLLRSCFNRFKAVAGQSYSTKTISLNSDQSLDDNEPDYVQIVNRVAENSDDRGSFSIVITAVAAIIVIAVASTVMRWENLQTELTNETTNTQAVHVEAKVDNGAGLSLDLPKDVTDPQQEADAKAKDESSSSTKIEGAFAFALLGFIFLLTQLVGIGAGYKYSFVGRETYKKVNGTWFLYDGAYADTGGISTYDTYIQVREPLMDLANSRLKDLQQRLEMNSSTRLDLGKSFNDYLVEQHLNLNSTTTRVNNAGKTSQAPAPEPVAAAQTPAIAVVNDANEDPRVTSAKAAITAMTDKEMAKNFYTSLPAEVRETLKPWLLQRKNEEQEAERKRQTELLEAQSRQQIAAEADELF